MTDDTSHVFHSEYLQIPSESREEAAVRELAEHCVDLIDEYENMRCRYKSPITGSGIPITSYERADCRRYAEDVKEEMYWFASLLAPIDRREWRQIVLEATRRKNQWENERKRYEESE